jgi:hypothetical protein
MSDARVTGLCLVEPAAFGFNVETADTNHFQQRVDLPAASAVARDEFAALVANLDAAGARVCIASDTASPPKPDAIFPNNWVSFHEDGTIVLYPMQSPVRRLERRESVIDSVKQSLGFRESRRIDYSAEESRGRHLEGTGSLVLDRCARIAYACRSQRTDESLVHRWARDMGYEAFVFDATTRDGAPVYHTNVLLWIGANIAGIGAGWIPAPQRDRLLERLRESGKTALLLDDAQLHAFAGNMLEVETAAGTRRLVMSASAAASLREEQLAMLHDAGSLPLVSAVPTIERLGGGSVRCMIAEVPGQTGIHG